MSLNSPPADAGMAALHLMSSVVHHLLSADTGLHTDGSQGGEDAQHRHPLLSGEDRTTFQALQAQVDSLIERSTRIAAEKCRRCGANAGNPHALICDPMPSMQEIAAQYAGPATVGDAALEVVRS